jgi:hypothetical protein
MLPTPAATAVVTPSPAVTPSPVVTGGLATDETPFTATQAPDAPGPGVSGTPEPALTMPFEHPLETRLPRQLRGAPVRVDVTAGPDIDLGTDADMLRFIAEAGAMPGDVTMAVGWSDDGGWDGRVAAIQVRGADPGRLLQSFLDTVRTAGGAAIEQTAQSIAGRSVTRVVDRDSPEQGPTYLMAIGDTLFLVQSIDAAVAEEAIRAFK